MPWLLSNTRPGARAATKAAVQETSIESMAVAGTHDSIQGHNYKRPAKRSHFSAKIASALRISSSAGMQPVDSMVKMKWSLRLRSCMLSRHRSCSSKRRTYSSIEQAQTNGV